MSHADIIAYAADAEQTANGIGARDGLAGDRA